MAAAWRLISDHPEITAIFTHNDVMAFGAANYNSL
jgi:ABC-type sugar transport system substrate-binding protein